MGTNSNIIQAGTSQPHRNCVVRLRASEDLRSPAQALGSNSQEAGQSKNGVINRYVPGGAPWLSWSLTILRKKSWWIESCTNCPSLSA